MGISIHFGMQYHSPVCYPGAWGSLCTLRKYYNMRSRCWLVNWPYFLVSWNCWIGLWSKEALWREKVCKCVAHRDAWVIRRSLMCNFQEMWIKTHYFFKVFLLQLRLITYWVSSSHTKTASYPFIAWHSLQPSNPAHVLDGLWAFSIIMWWEF